MLVLLLILLSEYGRISYCEHQGYPEPQTNMSATKIIAAAIKAGHPSATTKSELLSTTNKMDGQSIRQIVGNKLKPNPEITLADSNPETEMEAKSMDYSSASSEAQHNGFIYAIVWFISAILAIFLCVKCCPYRRELSPSTEPASVIRESPSPIEEINPHVQLTSQPSDPSPPYNPCFRSESPPTYIEVTCVLENNINSNGA